MNEEAFVRPEFEYVESLVHSLVVDGYEDRAVAEARNDGAHGPVRCWEHRGCEGLMGLTHPMEEECPHNRRDCYSPCPAECKYTACSRPWHSKTSDFNLILDDTVDRFAAVKKNCYTCAYFLKNAPRVGERSAEGDFVPDAATRDSDSSVTIHLF